MIRPLMLLSVLALGACAGIDASPRGETERPYHQQFIEFYQDL